jgi:hypothetical protein
VNSLNYGFFTQNVYPVRVNTALLPSYNMLSQVDRNRDGVLSPQEASVGPRLSRFVGLPLADFREGQAIWASVSAPTPATNFYNPTGNTDTWGIQLEMITVSRKEIAPIYNALIQLLIETPNNSPQYQSIINRLAPLNMLYDTFNKHEANIKTEMSAAGLQRTTLSNEAKMLVNYLNTLEIGSKPYNEIREQLVNLATPKSSIPQALDSKQADQYVVAVPSASRLQIIPTPTLSRWEKGGIYSRPLLYYTTFHDSPRTRGSRP